MAPEDYFSPEDYEMELGQHLADSIRPICVWRAVRIGWQVGRFIMAYARTFDEKGDIWLMWRRGEVPGAVSDWVRRIERGLFIFLLAARNLLLVRPLSGEDDGVLWVPADEGLASVSGILQIEATDDLVQWRELLGDPPGDVNLMGLLYLANLAAVAQLGEFEISPTRPGFARESQDQLNRMEEMLKTLQGSQDEALQRQDAVVDELMRMAEHMEHTDRHTCEESVLSQLPAVWGKLTPEVRSLMLASEQMHRVPGFAAPGKFIDGFATAFECQLKHTIMSHLFAHLKSSNVRELRPLPEWRDAEERNRPLWGPKERADMCGLGAARLILRHTEPAVEEFFERFGFDRATIQRAVEAVYKHRNTAVHGGSFDPGIASAIRADWLSWEGRAGGVFSVFFRDQ